MVLLVLVSACGDDGADLTDPDSATVSMPGFSFVPFAMTIDRGGTVTFDFPAEAHNVIFERITGAPEDIQATSNRKVTRKFDVTGTFPYDCTLHPGMSGTIAVR
ncbi:MAG TPA: plastocyanin/azurin family copper-binding protein [Longimicrobiales bacterium]|nr:plastocyanin/azurin family copper-binding protein [Longimicrobiales bacterium]